jgi:hypothetical protein
MGRVDSAISAEDRARLARKGEILYGKFCGTGGRGICAEFFALHQTKLGNIEVVRDLLRFLDARIDALRARDDDDRLAITEALAARIRRNLEDEAPPDE